MGEVLKLVLEIQISDEKWDGLLENSLSFRTLCKLPSQLIVGQDGIFL